MKAIFDPYLTWKRYYYTRGGGGSVLDVTPRAKFLCFPLPMTFGLFLCLQARHIRSMLYTHEPTVSRSMLQTRQRIIVYFLIAVVSDFFVLCRCDEIILLFSQRCSALMHAINKFKLQIDFFCLLLSPYYFFKIHFPCE